MKILVSIGLVVTATLALAQTQGEPTRLLETVKSGRIDTRQFFPQIDDSTVLRAVRPSNPNPLVTRGSGGFEQNTLPLGGVTKKVDPIQSTKFPGISFTFSWPPDTHMAVGPNHAVMGVNSKIAFFNKSNGAKVFEQTYDAFFGSLATSSTFDPKVVYDRIHNRFFTIIINSDTDTMSEILFAISDDDDPNGTWHKYSVNTRMTLNGTAANMDCWGDYPGLGYNKDGFLMTFNMFPLSGSGFGGMQFVSVPFSSVQNGGSVTVTKHGLPWENEDVLGTSLQPCEMVDAATSKMYTVSRTQFGGNNNTRIQFYVLNNLGGTSTFNIVPINVTVASYTNPPGGAPVVKSAANLVDGLDGRVINAYFKNGKIVASHTVNGSSPFAVRWHEFNVNTTTDAITLSQEGTISDGSNDIHMSAIAINDAGRIGVVTSRGSTSIAGDIVFTSRVPSDPPGTMAALTTLGTSSGTNYRLQRWGDYAAACIDPVNNNDFWVAHMAVDSATANFGGSTGNSNLWNTQFFKIDLGPALSTLVITPTQLEGGSSMTGDVTLTANAPAGGTTVGLSDDSANVTVPGTVLVPAGASTASFTITSSAVTSTSTVTVTATLNAVTRTDTFQLTPIATPTALTFSPSPGVTSGKTSTGTVTITSAAPAGGAVLTASDNSTALATPGTVTVPAGATTGTFVVTANQVTANTNVTVTVTRNAVSRTANLIVVPVKFKKFDINALVVMGKLPVVGKIETTGPAPASFVVTVTDNSTATNFTSPQTVPQGAESHEFTINTLPVVADTLSTVTVTRNGQSVSDSVTVLTPVLIGMGIKFATLKGGLSMQATCSINGHAPTPGCDIALSSDGPQVIVPSSVNVVFNTKIIAWTVQTTTVTSSVTRTITASRNGVTKTRQVTVVP